MKAKQEHGEGQPSAPVLTNKMPWKPSLYLENTWAEGIVEAGLSTTAPSTQVNQASMPGLSSTVSGTSSVGAKIESTRAFLGGSNASSPRGGPPPNGEGQPSASATAQAEPVDDEPRDFQDLRDNPEIEPDDGASIVIDEAWYEGPEEPQWTNISHQANCPNFPKASRGTSWPC